MFILCCEEIEQNQVHLCTDMYLHNSYITLVLLVLLAIAVVSWLPETLIGALPCPSIQTVSVACGPCLLCMHESGGQGFPLNPLTPSHGALHLQSRSCCSVPAISRQMLLTAMDGGYILEINGLSERVIHIIYIPSVFQVRLKRLILWANHNHELEKEAT